MKAVNRKTEKEKEIFKLIDYIVLVDFFLKKAKWNNG
jgi:hypothetical protein